MSEEKNNHEHKSAADFIEYLVNSGGASGRNIRQMVQMANSGGYDFADTLHNIYLDYGYPAELSFSNYWNMYRRFGVAARVVNLYPQQTWLSKPTIDSSPSVERDIEILSDKGLYTRLEGVDKRQRVGSYAGLFMRVRDNKKPNEPIDGTLAGIGSLVDILPLYESQLEVLTTEQDPTSDEYGQPTMYQFNGTAPGARSDDVASTFDIHPSRVIVAAEGADNGSIYGIPALESIYNSLMDLRKVLGGGGEGFYKNASQSVLFDLKDPKTASANASLLSEFNENYDDFQQNRMRRGMWTPGLEANTLESSLMSPKDFADSILLDISAGSGIPVAMLAGNQTGVLAGDQDTKGFLSGVQARRESFGDQLLRSVIDWLMLYGVMERAEYSIEWPDAMAPSSEEKLESAGKMSKINHDQFMSGGDIPFDGNEIREMAGYESDDIEPMDALVEPEEGEEDAN